MALTCNTAWSNNTVAATLPVVQCMTNLDRLAPSELIDDDEKFLALVLDAIERLRVKGTFTIPALVNIVACDAQQAAYQANCALADRAMPSNNLSPAKIKSAIIWQLTQALCS